MCPFPFLKTIFAIIGVCGALTLETQFFTQKAKADLSNNQKYLLKIPYTQFGSGFVQQKGEYGHLAINAPYDQVRPELLESKGGKVLK